jgi:medium-chain acyl-[acyl-carrier-protein] hydrolase
MIERWLSGVRPRAEARVRLFLFPYAGGGASLFHGWAGALPSAVDVLAVQLPGREERLGEPAFTRMAALADAVAEILWPLGDRPVVLFGWSMGAALAHAVALRWESLGRRPALLIPAAQAAPHLAVRRPSLHRLASPAFWREVAKLGGVADEMLACRELCEVIEPMLRADFAAIETMARNRPRTLECPITAIAAKGDRLVSREEVLAWTRASRGPSTVMTIDGGHFAVRDDAGSVVSAIAGALAAHGLAGPA